MRILVVCSGNHDQISPFVKEQTEAISQFGLVTDYYVIKGKGLVGYLKNYFPLLKKIRAFKPDIVHAHYGFSGFLANLQRKIPVVVTFHGSDINQGGFGRIISQLSIILSKYNIFVSSKLAVKVGVKNKYSVISCGVNMNNTRKLDKLKCRNELGFGKINNYVLFSSSFNNPIKNYNLAKAAVDQVKNVVLIELKGYTREQVNLLMNACDFLLVTSLNESGPLVIKEAMACGCPVISTDVGDVKEVIGETEGCYICSYDPIDVADKIKTALAFNKRTNGRQRIIELGLDSETIANKIIEIYKKVLNEKH